MSCLFDKLQKIVKWALIFDNTIPESDRGDWELVHMWPINEANVGPTLVGRKIKEM